MWFGGEPFGIVLTIGIPDTGLCPRRRHVAQHVHAGAWSADFVDIIQTVGVQQVLASAQISSVRVQVCFTKQAGAVAAARTACIQVETPGGSLYGWLYQIPVSWG